MKGLVRIAGYLLVAFPVIAILAFNLIFDVPEKPQQLVINQQEEEKVTFCYQSESAGVIDVNGRLNLLVWNLYKQNRDNWEKSLTGFSRGASLILLQEASLTPTFRDWINRQSWGSNYVNAFKAFDTSAGVLNLASSFPSEACAYTAVEPWLRLPKSALYARYALSDGSELAVINVHAINFTVGTLEFEGQIEALTKAVVGHRGPLVMAGDFNTWSEERLKTLKELAAALQLKEVEFSPDNRTRFLNGLPLDHVFYRELELIKAEAPVTDASDHNPLLASFRLLRRR